MSKLCWVGFAVAIRAVNSLELKVGFVFVNRAANAVVIRDVNAVVVRAMNAVVNSVEEVSVGIYTLRLVARGYGCYGR